MRNWLVLLLCLSLMVSAQTLWKIGLSQLGVVDVGAGSLLPLLGRLLRNWRIVLGLLIFAFTTLLWFDLLSRMELSLLYPFMSLSYVMAFFTGWLWLGESPQPQRLLGILVICAGIYLVSRTGH